MKTIALFILASLSAVYSFGQKTEEPLPIPYDANLQKYAYSKIIEVPGKDAAALYTLAKNWCKQKYSDETFSVNTENERLTHAGSFPIVVQPGDGPYGYPTPYTILYTITFLFKEGKSKLEITDMKLSANAQGTTHEMTLEVFKEQMDAMAAKKKKFQVHLVDVFKLIHTELQEIIHDAETSLKGQKNTGDDW